MLTIMLKSVYNECIQLKRGGILMKKRFFKTLCLLLTFTFLASLQALAEDGYLWEPSMNPARGFNYGYSTNVKMKYYQYGDTNWSSCIDYAVNQIRLSPANISLSNQSYYSYNELSVVVSSNWWPNYTFVGQAAQIDYNYTAQKTVKLNSAVQCSIRAVATTHEFAHIFGIRDCSKPSSIACGSATFITATTMTSDVNNLLISRYGYK